ncbi:hypothetical protein SNE40_010777 [Patella caerulea]|uniref:FLYWCH-type domain-containing protein n=1 Tax=Patella caerulea TaxID=87958 RepID=A0AAN8Q0M9_PATCE
MEYITSERGQQKLSYQGFICLRDRILANGAVAWECEKSRHSKCKARVKIQGDDGDPVRHRVPEVKNTIKRRVTGTLETAQRIVTAAVVNLPEGTAAQLPPIRHLKRAVRRFKNTAGNPQPLPPTQHAMEIPEQYKEIFNGERFLLYHSGTNNPARILLYSTEKSLRTLTSAGHRFADGTFKVAPENILPGLHHTRSCQQPHSSMCVCYAHRCVYAMLIYLSSITSRISTLVDLVDVTERGHCLL